MHLLDASKGGGCALIDRAQLGRRCKDVLHDADHVVDRALPVVQFSQLRYPTCQRRWLEGCFDLPGKLQVGEVINIGEQGKRLGDASQFCNGLGQGGKTPSSLHMVELYGRFYTNVWPCMCGLPLGLAALRHKFGHDSKMGSNGSTS